MYGNAHLRTDGAMSGVALRGRALLSPRGSSDLEARESVEARGRVLAGHTGSESLVGDREALEPHEIRERREQPRLYGYNEWNDA